MSRPGRGPFVGGLLRFAWQGVRRHMLDDVRSSGYEHMTAAQLNLFRNPGMDGRRPSDFADELGISKQALNDLLRGLEDMGYVTREVDPSDRRGRILRLTRAGRVLEDRVWEAARLAERRLESALGKARVRELRRTLVDAAEELGRLNE